jgi:GNAT superfamily N-acetyltransferase
VLEEHRLDSNIHNCASFDCGVPALNDYLQRYASQDRRRNISQVYVLVDSDKPGYVFGYYTLSAAQIDAEEIANDERRRLPRYPIPCFRMGRLAIANDSQKSGFGKIIIGCAVDRCLRARQEVAAYALIVEALDESAKAYYLHFGFAPFADKPLSLYLPLSKS